MVILSLHSPVPFQEPARSAPAYCFLVLSQDKLTKELEAANAERMKVTIQAAADKQLAEARHQVLTVSIN